MENVTNHSVVCLSYTSSEDVRSRRICAAPHLEAGFADHRHPMMHKPLALSSIHDALIAYHALSSITSPSGVAGDCNMYIECGVESASQCMKMHQTLSATKVLRSCTLKHSVMPMSRKHISACLRSPLVKTYIGSRICCSNLINLSSRFRYRSYGSVWCTCLCQSSTSIL